MSISKENLLISYLLKQSAWVTSDTLANYLDLSTRSINNYVSRINKKYGEIILSSNKGYSAVNDKAIAVLNALPDSNIPRNFEERKQIIIEKLLLSHQSVTIDSLANKFCISRITLLNELSKFRLYLKKYKLQLRIKEDRLSIIGSDRKKHELVMMMINKELENFSFRLDKLQTIFAVVDLNIIRKIILNILKDYDYFLDDYSLLNYILHIAVFIELRGGLLEKNENDSQKLNLADIASPHIKEIIDKIYVELAENFECDFSREDFFEVSLPVMTNAVSNQITQLQLNQLSSFVGEEINDLLFEIIRQVQDTYSIDLADDKFLIRFAYHLKNVVLRAKNNVSVGNSQLIKIKNEFPLIYVIAVFVSKIIKNKIGLPIPKDEIAYIALHIGAIMEEKKAYNDKLKCIVLAPGLNIVNRTLFQRLKNIFSESIIITNFIGSTDDLPQEDEFDIFLSTIDINPQDIGPELVSSYLLIDQFLSEESVNKIFLKINDVKQVKIRQNFLKKIKFFFREDLFFFNQPFATQDDAIEVMCNRMIEKNYVDKDYKDEIYEHEAIASSAYGNIAIPHPLSNNAQSSVISISINPEPVNWGGKEVNLIFMLSLEEQNNYLFKEIFHFIIQIISNFDSYNQIMQASTYQEFLDILVAYSSL
jgi:lichenan operon transcriptional antiterminator